MRWEAVKDLTESSQTVIAQHHPQGVTQSLTSAQPVLYLPICSTHAELVLPSFAASSFYIEVLAMLGKEMIESGDLNGDLN